MRIFFRKLRDILGFRMKGVFRAWDRDPGHREAVLTKIRSADLFCRFVGISSPIFSWGGGGLPSPAGTDGYKGWSGFAHSSGGAKGAENVCTGCLNTL